LSSTASESNLVGKVVSVSINQNKLMKKYLTPVGSAPTTPVESSPSPIDFSSLGVEWESSMFYKNVTQRPCIVVDVQRRSEVPMPGETPPITIVLITGFDGKPLDEVVSEEDYKRVVSIQPTPVIPSSTDSLSLRTTPEWLPHPKRKVPSYVLCIPIKVFPQNIRFFDDSLELDDQNLKKLKSHLIFLGGLKANADVDDSEGEDDDDDDLYLPSGEWNRIVSWDAIAI
jgi:hypothetical protein